MSSLQLGYSCHYIHYNGIRCTYRMLNSVGSKLPAGFKYFEYYKPSPCFFICILLSFTKEIFNHQLWTENFPAGIRCMLKSMISGLVLRPLTWDDPHGCTIGIYSTAAYTAAFFIWRNWNGKPLKNGSMRSIFRNWLVIIRPCTRLILMIHGWMRWWQSDSVVTWNALSCPRYRCI